MAARKVWAYLAVVLIGVLSVAFLRLDRGAQSLCEGWGGSWAPTQFRCITRSCFAAHTCGTRYCPACYCKTLMPGATIADVYVRLGEPSAVDGRKFRWVAGAADSGYVVAEIDNGHLESIACPDGERR